MIRNAIVALVTTLGGCCAAPTTPAPAPEPAPVVAADPGAPSMAECQAIIPGVNNFPEELVDAWFFAWVERFDTVDYHGSESGWWSDGTGHLIGWSAQEDDTICVTDWPGYPAGAPTFPATSDDVTNP